MIDLGRQMADFARPLPAISGNFNAVIAAQKPARPLPPGVKLADLNFLHQRPGTLFYYPYALYSAEFARRQRAGIVQSRDRCATDMFVDSGGFGFIKGSVSIDEIVDLRRDALRKQEELADSGVVVDVPTACIAERRPGAENFEKCLQLTQESIDYALQWRTPGRMKLLNVIQGRKNAEAQRWYEAVRHKSLDGFGFAGGRRKDIGLVLSLLVQMIAAGDVDGSSRFHVFGTAQPGVAIFLTAIQRQLRRLFNRPDLVISFDSSTSFSVVQRNGLIVRALASNRSAIRLENYRVSNRGDSIAGDCSWPFFSPLGDRAAIRDFLTQTGATGGERDRATDALGQQLLSHHSLFRELSAIIEANRLLDMEHGDDWKDRDTLAIPYSVHQGVDDIAAVFDLVQSGDFDRAGERALQSAWLNQFAKADEDEVR